MAEPARRQRPDPALILDVVAQLLETEGYDGWQVREVAQRARVSLRTVYEIGSRDQLIVAAVERWMAANVFRPVEAPSPDQPALEVLRDWIHAIFEPWERHPGMLIVFVRAARTPEGLRLHQQGLAAARPLHADWAPSLKSTFGADINVIMTNVTNGAINQFVSGQIEVTDILPVLDLTLDYLRPAATEFSAGSSTTKHPSRARLQRRARTPRDRAG